MLFNWFKDPANQKKVASIFRFIKDWWPAIVTGLILFAGSVIGPVGIVAGVIALCVGFIPKIINGILNHWPVDNPGRKLSIPP